jgi:DNA gyrase inhibitor GyrI
MDSSLPFFMFFFKRMMEGFIGMDYQRGLGMLKDYVESGSVPSALEFQGQSAFTGFNYVGVKSQCALEAVGPAMESDMGKLGSWIKEAGVEPAGMPFSIYHKWNIVKGTTDYTLGVPLKEVPASLPAEFVSGAIPSGAVYKVKHTGPYRHLGNAWAAGMMHGRSKQFRQNRGVDPFEIYESDPQETAEHELVTVVHFPAK